MRTATIIMVLTLALAPTLWADVQDTCNGSEILAGVTVPPTFNQSLATTTGDFTITGASCSADDLSASASDVVACFVPANNCSVTITCSTAGGDNAADLYEGACSTTVTDTCTATDRTTGGDAVINNQALTAGQQYCIACTNNGLLATITVDIAAQGGSDCGTMPIEIQHFDVE